MNGLLRTCITLFAASLGACFGQAPAPMRWKPFHMVERHISTGPINYLEANLATDGLVEVWREGKVYRFDPMVASGARSQVHEDPVPGMHRFYANAKFRHGYFYCRKDQTVYRYDPDKSAWSAILTPKPSFAQFEILTDGRVALICTRKVHANPNVPNNHWNPLRHELDIGPLEPGNLLEVYEPGSENPDKVVPYPDELKDVLDHTHFVYPIDRTLQIGDRFLLVHSALGNIYLWDPNHPGVKLLPVPWPTWGKEGIAKLTPLLSTCSPHQDNRPLHGVVQVDQRDFQIPLAFFPQDADTVQVLYPGRSKPKGYHLAHDQTARKEGNRYGQLQDEDEPEDVKRLPAWRVAELNLDNGTVKTLPDSFGMGLPGAVSSFWCFPNGVDFPIDEILKRVSEASLKYQKQILKAANPKATSTAVTPGTPPGGYDDPMGIVEIMKDHPSEATSHAHEGEGTELSWTSKTKVKSN